MYHQLNQDLFFYTYRFNFVVYFTYFIIILRILIILLLINFFLFFEIRYLIISFVKIRQCIRGIVHFSFDYKFLLFFFNVHLIERSRHSGTGRGQKFRFIFLLYYISVQVFPPKHRRQSDFFLLLSNSFDIYIFLLLLFIFFICIYFFVYHLFL